MLVGDVPAPCSENGGKPTADGHNELFWTEKFIWPEPVRRAPLFQPSQSLAFSETGSFIATSQPARRLSFPKIPSGLDWRH
jgi:hypothetical protein